MMEINSSVPSREIWCTVVHADFYDAATRTVIISVAVVKIKQHE